ncbi:MAG: sugar transferase [Candidatus Portnoybacteria bacterium]|nr:sugar transferase [Candidatus Portnoybacteria bacterium]
MIKRTFDIIVSFLGLVVLSPLLFIIALAIKMDSPGPILYRGLRVGRYGKPLYMYKFRTMVINADKIGGPTTSDDDPRVTPVGKLLRRFKLDEFPQLLNVVKGEMSIVGPRPDVEEVIALLQKNQKDAILSVRPGITDYASLKFPNEGEIVAGASDPHKAYLEKIWPTKVKLQLKYVQEQSLLTDIKIIFQTIKRVFL